jgi:3-phenylpropionate/trans-cinnamate dioxygenase ferredoxin subunit
VSAAAPKRFVVAKVDDVPEGTRLLVEVEGRSVGVFHVDGRFYALLNRCPHSGGPLCKGEVAKTIVSDGPGHFALDTTKTLIMCPWHGWEFDIESGQSYFDPKRLRVKPYPVTIERGESITVADNAYGERHGRALEKGPYVAEVIPISVDDDYLVVTMGKSQVLPADAA